MYSIVRGPHQIKGTDKYKIILMVRKTDDSGKRNKSILTLKTPPVTKEQWNPELSMYRKSMSGYNRFNTALRVIINRCEKVQAQLTSTKPNYSPKDFILEYRNFGKDPEEYLLTVSQNLENIVKRKNDSNEAATGWAYKNTMDRWNSFIKKVNGGKPVALVNLNLFHLDSFCNFLLKNKGMGGAKHRIVDMRAAFNSAIKYELIPEDTKSPFRKFDWTKTDGTVSHAQESLSRENWEKLKAYEPKTRSQEFHKDIFIFMVHCYGINMMDMITLTKDNLSKAKGENGEDLTILTYVRTKTRKKNRNKSKVEVTVDAVLQALIDKYDNPSGYLMPILNEKDRGMVPGSLEFITRMRGKKGNMRIRLSYLADKAGIDQKLTLYAARHTFATMVFWAGVDIRYISTAMGHSSVSQTQSYLKKIGASKVHQAIKGIL